jgi:hypothetical protein
MVRNCIRQGCRSTFEYMNKGQIYSLERRPLGTTEFYWICEECQTRFAVIVSPEGEVDVTPRDLRSRRVPPNPLADLRLFPLRFSRHVAA